MSSARDGIKIVKADLGQKLSSRYWCHKMHIVDKVSSQLHCCLKPILLTTLGALILTNANAQQGQLSRSTNSENSYVNLLNMHGSPTNISDRSFNIFFDEGAWQGYSLPPSKDLQTGFIGPFVHSWGNGKWAGTEFAEVSLKQSNNPKRIPLKELSGYSAPGYLERRFSGQGLKVTETLFFANSSSALVRIKIKSNTERELRVSISGRPEHALRKDIQIEGGAVIGSLPGSRSEIVTRLHLGRSETDTAVYRSGKYRFVVNGPLVLRPGQSVALYVVQTLIYDSSRPVRRAPIDFANAWSHNRRRWWSYLRVASRAHFVGVPKAAARRVAVKAIETLLGNWRSARGDLYHAGLIPSYSNPDFNGFWAWDSWKQAAALSLFAPKLAESQMLALFDYQAANGMIPDCIYLHESEDNWRNSKPPLATWAALKIYQSTKDKRFLRQLYPRLVRYHDWWYRERDHEHNGLAEYGSTDGTTLAAKWESGMDNAARFDGIKMLRNGVHAWSMNQEAVDLNSYLYRDAKGLAKIADILGLRRRAKEWKESAQRLRKRIQNVFYDQKRGYFFDIEIPNGAFVTTYGPEGWIPLWAGAATQKQADTVAHVIGSPQKFGTYMPFPSLAADDPRFSPITGYWRGPVWLDQAYFGVEGLFRYGHTRLAEKLAGRLIFHAKGLLENSPIYENYDPLTGVGYQSRNFSWSAASYLLLLLQQQVIAGAHSSAH